MAKFVALFLVALVFHSALCAPKGGQKTQLEEVVERIQNIGEKVSTSLREAIPDTKQVTETLTTRTQELATDVEQLVRKLETDIENNKGTADDALKQFTAQISQTLTSLRGLTGPDTNQKIDEYKVALGNNVKAVTDEFKRFEEAVLPDIEKTGDRAREFAEGAINDFVKAFQQFGNDLESSVNAEKNEASPQTRRVAQRPH